MAGMRQVFRRQCPELAGRSPRRWRRRRRSTRTPDPSEPLAADSFWDAQSTALARGCAARVHARSDFSCGGGGSAGTDAIPASRSAVSRHVDASQAKDGPEAAAKAWALFQPPGMQRKMLLTPALSRATWDEGTEVAYEVSPAVHGPN